MNRSAHSQDLPLSMGTHAGSESMDATRSFPLRFRPQSEGIVRDDYIQQGGLRSSDTTISSAASYPQIRTHSFEEQRTWNQPRPVSAHPRFHRVTERAHEHLNQPAPAQYDERGDYRTPMSSFDPSTHATQVRRTVRMHPTDFAPCLSLYLFIDCPPFPHLLVYHFLLCQYAVFEDP